MGQDPGRNGHRHLQGLPGATYVLTTAELAHTIKVKVSFTDDDGYSETVTSDATNLVTRPPNSLATGKPTITGTVGVGETLTAGTSGISDGNGMTSPGFTYQWVRTPGRHGHRHYGGNGFHLCPDR